MLGPVHCGQVSLAPLLPKLRGNFAEFLDNASSAGLRILSPPTCVGLRYGPCKNNSGFSRQAAPVLRYSLSLPIAQFPPAGGFASPPGPMLGPVFPFPAHHYHPRPHSSVLQGYRTLYLFPIGYAFRPRLRPRLTQGRSALPWKPRIFGRKDSHLPLATHSGILSSIPSTAPYRYSFNEYSMLLYQ